MTGKRDKTSPKDAPIQEPQRNKTEDPSESSDTDDEGAKEQEKVLKSLAFPDVETGSFSADLCPKVTKCISKRLTKLELHTKAFPDPTTHTEIQKKWGSRKLVCHDNGSVCKSYGGGVSVLSF